MADPNAANAAQWEHWNTVAGPKWVAFSDKLDRQLSQVGQLLLQAAAPRPGESVLDIGCGTGGMLVPLAEAVGDRGKIVGIDLSDPMLGAAWRRVTRASLGNVQLVAGDVQIHTFVSATFDLLVSRFGVMFFADPVAAFRNLYQAAGASGRLCFVCWGPLQENPHWALTLAAVARRLGPPAEKPPHAPGPMAFSDPAYVEQILRSAGFVDIAISRESPALVGTSPEEEAAFMCTMGPAASIIAEREPTAEVINQIKVELAAHFNQFVSGGRMLIPASIYLVQARRTG